MYPDLLTELYDEQTENRNGIMRKTVMTKSNKKALIQDILSCFIDSSTDYPSFSMWWFDSEQQNKIQEELFDIISDYVDE